MAASVAWLPSESAATRRSLGTDMACAWWAWQRPEQTVRALLDACRASLGKVRDRPAIRHIVTELAERHPAPAAYANRTPQ